jgi:hypothetical protein
MRNEAKPNNRLQRTGTLKVGQASKVLFRSRSAAKEVRPAERRVRRQCAMLERMMPSVLRFTNNIFRILAIGLFAIFLCAAQGFTKDLPRYLSDSELRLFIPDGYQSAKVLRYDLARKGYSQYLVALSDGNSADPQKPITLLYIDWDKKWYVKDKEVITNSDYMGNYYGDMRIETIGQTNLLYVYSYYSDGGSGSTHYYRFYSIEEGKLSLLKAFEHSRMERLYFCIWNNAIYDSELVKQRGEKKGNAFVYTCYLNVTKFTCDGKAIVALGAQRLREKQGNRFLDEQYWCMSVQNALKKGEVFENDFHKAP